MHPFRGNGRAPSAWTAIRTMCDLPNPKPLVSTPFGRALWQLGFGGRHRAGFSALWLCERA